MRPENKPLLHRAKQFVLHIMRAIGMFRVARWLTADKIRILCYHGISLNDEHRFRPALFMRPETFADRIEHLAIKGYPVISLDAACDFLERGGAENCAVVITIDDGWYGTYKHMLPILRRHAMPATLYVSTYYVQNQVQVFNVAVQYLIWSARRQPVELSGGPAQITDRFDLSMVAERERLFEAVIQRASRLDGASTRQSMLNSFASSLGVGWDDAVTNRICTFVNRDEARQLQEAGIDLQLHTHRHRFPANSFDLAAQELEDNRRALSDIAPHSMAHFCYPSGVYSSEQVAWVTSLGMRSATTTRPGLNDKSVPMGELRRFLDSDDISPIEFEAEISGLLWIVRRVFGRK